MATIRLFSGSWDRSQKNWALPNRNTRPSADATQYPCPLGVGTMSTKPGVTVDPGDPNEAASPRATTVEGAAAVVAANALAPGTASCKAMTAPATSNHQHSAVPRPP